MLAVQEPVPGFLGADAGVPLGGERASGHPAGRPGLLLPQERGAPLSWPSRPAIRQTAPSSITSGVMSSSIANQNRLRPPSASVQRLMRSTSPAAHSRIISATPCAVRPHSPSSIHYRAILLQ